MNTLTNITLPLIGSELTVIEMPDNSAVVAQAEEMLMDAAVPPPAGNRFGYHAFDAPVADELRETAALIRD